MASRTGNDAVRALRARQEVERRAVRAVEQSASALADAAERRRELLAKVDGEVGDASAAHELSVVVLAAILRDDGLAAELAGVDVSRVRALRRTVDGKAVRERIAQLGSVVPRRGRQPASEVGSRGGAVGDAEPAAGLVDGG
ncbi:hypothetical protein ACIODS_17035 [Micromonospora chalcea]|jgi:hypothetical protein|uniref:hypothetical protein n=1 Tax=Micromonospora TaxID=1873 RepID=UPI00114CEC22|nr:MULTISPECIES: hypothetical protein [Micromonospora]